MNHITDALFGNRDAKRDWDTMQARAMALPVDYRTTYANIRTYLFRLSSGDASDTVNALSRILDLFETRAREGDSVHTVTGPDLAGFTDTFIHLTPAYEQAWRDQLNAATRGAH